MEKKILEIKRVYILLEMFIHFYHTETIGHFHQCSQVFLHLGLREGRDKAKMLLALSGTQCPINLSDVIKASAICIMGISDQTSSMEAWKQKTSDCTSLIRKESHNSVQLHSVCFELLSMPEIVRVKLELHPKLIIHAFYFVGLL